MERGQLLWSFGEAATYPLGCCKSETMSSTAVELAMEAIPGRVTVHIWSRVRSVRDCRKKGRSATTKSELGAQLTSIGATMSLQ